MKFVFGHTTKIKNSCIALAAKKIIAMHAAGMDYKSTPVSVCNSIF
jgi:hypothetical protein